jgi:hypothetical protein
MLRLEPIRSALGDKIGRFSIFLATLAVRQQKQTITFRSVVEMLEVFGMQPTA